MKVLVRLRKLVWPILEPFTSQQLVENKASDDKKDAIIAALSLKKQAATALEEARRLSDMENERRRAADQKATTYLTFVAAIVPLILTFASALWDKKVANVPTWINVCLLLIALVYTLRAGRLAFDVLKVAASHRLGFSDFDAVWKQSDPTIHLTRSILQTVRLNEDGTNLKVSGIKMTHAFLFRSFLAFLLLLVVNILWPLGDAVAARFNLTAFLECPAAKPELQSPPTKPLSKQSKSLGMQGVLYPHPN